MLMRMMLIGALIPVLLGGAAKAELLPELVKDIYPGSVGGAIGNTVEMGDFLLFAGRTPTTGRELWRTDGTAEGTFLVKDIFSGDLNTNHLDRFARVGDRLFFTARSTGPQELWVSDGTEAGTQPLTTLTSNLLFNMMEWNGSLVFSYDDGIHGQELWVSNGTATGTHLLFDFDPFGSNSMLPLIVFEERLVFSSGDGLSGTSLYATDGTLEGTEMLHPLSDNPTFGGSAKEVVVWNDLLIFNGSSNPTTSRVQPWRSDGTFEGTYPIMGPVWAGAPPGTYFPFGDAVYFSWSYAQVGSELFRTDGTAEGTYMVKDIDPRLPVDLFQGASRPQAFRPLRDAFVFVARDVQGLQLWRSDGTEEGTEMVKQINPSGHSFDSDASGNLFVVNGKLFLSVRTSGAPNGLWRSDGTADGTVLIEEGLAPRNFAVVNGWLLLMGTRPGVGSELFRLPLPPWVESITAANPQGGAEAVFAVRFSGPVSGVTVDDFTVEADGLPGASVLSVEEESPRDYVVRVDTGAALSGALRLHLVDDGSIVETRALQPLEGYGIADGSAASEWITIEKSSPIATLDTTTPNFQSGPIAVELTFNVPVDAFDASALALDNGVVSDWSGGGASWSFTVTAQSPGRVEIQLPAGTVNAAESGAPNLASNEIALWVTAAIEAPCGSVPPDVRLHIPVLTPFFPTSPPVWGLDLDNTTNEDFVDNIASMELQFSYIDGTTANFEILPDGLNGLYTLRKWPACAGTAQIVVEMLDGTCFKSVAASFGENIALGSCEPPSFSVDVQLTPQAAGPYTPGAAYPLRVDIDYEGTPVGWVLEVRFPGGWQLTSATGPGDPQLTLGTADPVVSAGIQWDSIPESPFHIDLHLEVPEDGSGDAELATAFWHYVQGSRKSAFNALIATGPLPEGEGQTEGAIDGEGVGDGEGTPEAEADGDGEGEGQAASPFHSADQAKAGFITLSELLRVIQFFNAEGYHCGDGTEDGYAHNPDPDKTDCAPHDSDYNPQDWVITLTELLRLIQIFNVGAYHPCPHGEDGFCTGPAL